MTLSFNSNLILKLSKHTHTHTVSRSFPKKSHGSIIWTKNTACQHHEEIFYRFITSRAVMNFIFPNNFKIVEKLWRKSNFFVEFCVEYVFELFLISTDISVFCCFFSLLLSRGKWNLFWSILKTDFGPQGTHLTQGNFFFSNRKSIVFFLFSSKNKFSVTKLSSCTCYVVYCDAHTAGVSI